MTRLAYFTIAIGISVPFADPHTPRPPGSIENTNGLRRQCFPKADLSTHSQHDLDNVAHLLDTRPHETLKLATPPKASIPFSPQIVLALTG